MSYFGKLSWLCVVLYYSSDLVRAPSALGRSRYCRTGTIAEANGSSELPLGSKAEEARPLFLGHLPREEVIYALGAGLVGFSTADGILLTGGSASFVYRTWPRKFEKKWSVVYKMRL